MGAKTGNATGRAPRLGALESLVMDALWDHGPLTVRQVIELLPGEPAYTTVATVLGHLDGKGMLTLAKRGRSTLYSARHAREERAASLMGEALASGGDHAVSILHFVDGMPESDRALLREYLDRDRGGA